MIYRTTNNKSTDWSRYGGRDIKVCDKWKNDFMSFYLDMFDGYKKHCDTYGLKNTTIDRIDVNGNYEKSNCRWATLKEQQNNKTTNRFVRIGEEAKTLKEWSEELNINYGTVMQRINKYGFPISKALNVPYADEIIIGED